MKIKNIIYLLFILIMSCSVFSFNTFYQYGNGEKITAYCGFTEFSSCYPQSDLSLNFTKYSLSQSMTVNPIIYYHQNDLYTDNTQKFLYAFSGANMYSYYTNNFALYNTNILKGTILFEPQFVRFSGFDGYLLVYPYSSAGQYYVNICDADVNGNICKDTDVTFNISNSTIDFIVDKQTGYITTLNSNGNFYTYNLLGTLIYSASTGATPSTPAITPPNTDKYLSVGDFDSDGYSELYWAIPKAYHIPSNYVVTETIGGFKFKDFYGYVLTPTNISILMCNEAFCSSSVVSNSRLNAVTIGSQTSSPQLHIFISYGYYWSSAVLRRANLVYAQNGIQTYSDIVSPSTTSILNTNAVFTDVNYDSYNEMCVNRGDATPNYRIFCYDSSYTSLFNISTSQQVYMSMAKYTDNAYESILLRDGIYDYNSTALNKVYNFTGSLSDDVVYPVSLYSKVNYSNDIFIVSTNKVTGYKLSSPSAVCGNLICEASETPLLCAIDCFVPENITINASKKNPTVACLVNAECLSGVCSNYRCSYVLVNGACAVNSQCLSQVCTNHICEQSSLSQKLDDWKNSTFGFDEATSNIIALVGIFLITIILAIVGFLVTKHFLPSIVLGALGFIASVVFFTYFGWLSGFILFTIIILVIGGIMLFIFLKGK